MNTPESTKDKSAIQEHFDNMTQALSQLSTIDNIDQEFVKNTIKSNVELILQDKSLQQAYMRIRSIDQHRWELGSLWAELIYEMTCYDARSWDYESCVSYLLSIRHRYMEPWLENEVYQQKCSNLVNIMIDTWIINKSDYSISFDDKIYWHQ